MSMSKRGPLNADDSVAYKRWEIPYVQADVPAVDVPALPTVKELEAIQKEAYEEGFNKGYKDGKVAGWAEGSNELEAQLKQSEAELQEKIRRFEHLNNFYARPLAELDEQIVHQLAELASIIARQIIRRELHVDPGQVVAVVREALACLPVGIRSARIHLHPEDATLVREALSLPQGDDAIWSVVDDPVQHRGGCRIETEHSKIDASVEQRINRVIATFLGGEREDDRRE